MTMQTYSSRNYSPCCFNYEWHAEGGDGISVLISQLSDLSGLMEHVKLICFDVLVLDTSFNLIKLSVFF